MLIAFITCLDSSRQYVVNTLCVLCRKYVYDVNGKFKPLDHAGTDGPGKAVSSLKGFFFKEPPPPTSIAKSKLESFLMAYAQIQTLDCKE